MIRKRYRARRAIAIDVDGTLLIGGQANEALVDWIKAKKEEGFELTLWSARGRAYAKQVAQHLEVEQLFDSIISKPGAIVDDKGWSWVKWTKVLEI